MAERCTISSVKNYYKDFKRHLRIAIIYFCLFLIVMTIGTLLFFYIEQCYDVTPKQLDEFTTSYLRVCSLFHSLQPYNATTGSVSTVSSNSSVLNQAIVDMCKKGKPKTPVKCELTGQSFWHWWDYTITLSYTIGYGQTVPYSRTGRIITGFYGIPAIGITMAMNIYLGLVFVDGTKILIALFYIKILRQRVVYYLPLKVFVYQVGVAVVCCILYAEMNRQWRFDDISMTDAMYFSFITLTTVGFGDIYYDRVIELRTEETIRLTVLALTFFTGMGVMTSSLTGLSELFTSKVRKPKQKRNFMIRVMKKMYSEKSRNKNHQDSIAISNSNALDSAISTNTTDTL